MALSGLGAASALDAQSIAVFGLMSCAGPVQRGLLTTRLLAPLAIDNTFEGMIIGNLILVGLVGLLQLTFAAAAVHLRGWTWGNARGLVRFPGLLYAAVILCHQGTAAAALQILVAGDTSNPTSIALAAIGLCMACLAPIAATVVVRRYVTSTYFEYKFTSLEALPAWVRGPLRVFLPMGRWEPFKVRKQFGNLYAGFRRSELLWCSLPLWGPTLTVIGSAFRPPSDAGCGIQYGIMAGMQALVFLVIVVFRPYRSYVMNFLSAASSLSLVCVLVGNALVSVNTAVWAAQNALLVAIQVQLGITGAKLLYATVLSLLEARLLKAVPREEGVKRVATCPGRPKLLIMDDSEGGEDLFAFVEPLNQAEASSSPAGSPRSSELGKEDEMSILKKVSSDRLPSSDGPNRINRNFVPAGDFEELVLGRAPPPQEPVDILDETDDRLMFSALLGLGGDHSREEHYANALMRNARRTPQGVSATTSVGDQQWCRNALLPPVPAPSSSARIANSTQGPARSLYHPQAPSAREDPLDDVLPLVPALAPSSATTSESSHPRRAHAPSVTDFDIL